MKANVAYILSKKYTDDSMQGAGAVAGKPCQIQSITDITGGKRITFLWVDNAGTSHTSVMDVKDGIDAVQISDIVATVDNKIKVVMDDGTEYVTAEIPTIQGEEGKDAYEVAVEEGYVGTREEWLESLVGEQGDEGFSPEITIKESTSERYVLSITNKDGSYDTPNLKGGGGSASALSDLEDVLLTSLTTGQIIKWNGSMWVNEDGVEIDSLGDINDVLLTNVQDGQILKYDSTLSKWVNTDAVNPTQFAVMPVASDYPQSIVQYTGSDTANYKKGYFYWSKPSIESGVVVYTWTQIDVEPSSRNYEDLDNHPEINSVELVGNKSLDDLGINGKFQFTELEPATVAIVGKIVQYVGAATVDLKPNYFYQVRYDAESGLYKWFQVDVSSNAALESAVATLQTNQGDMATLEIGGVSDIVSALNALNNKDVQTITYTEPNLVITYKNGHVVNFDVRTILVDLEIGELANILDATIQDTNVLQYDSSILKYKPYDIVGALTTLLTTSKDYTDEKIASSVQNSAYLCDEKPILYHDETTGEYSIIYKQNGQTKTTTNTEARFYYTADSVPYCTSWIDGTEFSYVISAANWEDYVNKNTDITSTYTEDMIDKTKVPNVSALDALLAIVKTALALKVNVADIVDALTSQDAAKVLSAKQGYVLNGLIDAKQDKIQYTSLPLADASLSGVVVQYIGIASGAYKRGAFYTCKYNNDTDTWYWEEIEFAPDMTAITAAEVDALWE